MALGLGLGVPFRQGVAGGPASPGDILQLLYGIDSDGITILDKKDVVNPQPEVRDVNVLDFTGVTGGGLEFAQIVGDESVTEWGGTGVQPTISAGCINCDGTGIIHSITLSSGIRFVASAGSGSACYSSNGKDLFTTREMLAGLEMTDNLEVV